MDHLCVRLFAHAVNHALVAGIISIGPEQATSGVYRSLDQASSSRTIYEYTQRQKLQGKFGSFQQLTMFMHLPGRDKPS